MFFFLVTELLAQDMKWSLDCADLLLFSFSVLLETWQSFGLMIHVNVCTSLSNILLHSTVNISLLLSNKSLFPLRYYDAK